MQCICQLSKSQSPHLTAVENPHRLTGIDLCGDKVFMLLFSQLLLVIDLRASTVHQHSAVSFVSLLQSVKSGLDCSPDPDRLCLMCQQCIACQPENVLQALYGFVGHSF